MGTSIGRIIGFVNGKPVYEIRGGSESAVETAEPQENSPQGSSENENTGAEATQAPYAEYLEKFPDSLRPTAESVFKEWDANTSRKFQQVHSQYEPLKAYEQFAKEQIAPDELAQAHSVLRRLQEDPRSVFETIGRAYGFLGEQGQQETQTGSEGDEFSDEENNGDPRLVGLENMTHTMAEYLVKQEEERRIAEEDARVDKELSELKGKYGDFDEAFVLTQMLHGKSGEEAVKAFNEIVEKAVAARKAPSAPPILGSGGGVVSEPVDVSKMTPKERKAYITEALSRTQE